MTTQTLKIALVGEMAAEEAPQEVARWPQMAHLGQVDGQACLVEHS